MSAFVGETYVEDALPQNETLAEHDKKKHPDGFDPETDSCKFREGITTETETDRADEVSSDKDGQANASKTTTKPKEGGISHIFTGSAANYDKPSLLKVGTGEGQQVYGWGLYGSTVRGVAESYSLNDSLRKSGLAQDPGYDMPENGLPQWAVDSAREKLRKHGWNQNSKGSAISEVSEAIDKHKSLGHDKFAEGLEIVKDILEKSTWHNAVIPNGYGTNNNIYEQTFFTDRASGDESHLLKWYSNEHPRNLLKNIRNNLSPEQLDAFNRAYNKAYRSGPGGRAQAVFNGDVYEILSDILGAPKSASEFLRDKCDIDGVKYPVDSYRGPIRDGDKAGWNYVSFRDDNIRIDKKYVDGQKMYDYEELMARHHSNIDPMEVLSYLSKLDTPEEMTAEFARIMESDKIEKDKKVQDELVEALVMDAETLKDQTLQEHDRIHHKEGYHEGDTCKFRDKMKEETPEDEADEVYVEGKGGKTEETVDNKPLVTPEEDAAYMEAVEKGDTETASRMVREIAARAFPNTKVLDSDGLPKIMFHGTEWDGKGAFLPGRVYFATEQGVEEFIDGAEGMNSLPLFVNITNPFYAQEGMTREDGSSYKGYGGREDVTGDDVTWGEDVQGDLERRGYDGIIDTFEGDAIEDDAFFNCVFNSRNIKSAAPVTYDDNGNVIPLSRRFDDGDDIRGDVSGKSEYVEKMKSLHPDINSEELIDRLKNLGSREEMEAEIKKILGNK